MSFKCEKCGFRGIRDNVFTTHGEVSHLVIGDNCMFFGKSGLLSIKETTALRIKYLLESV